MEQETEETWPDLAEAALSLLFSSLSLYKIIRV
jgi:hypothetical protein